MERLALFGAAIVVVLSCGSDAAHMMGDAAEDVAVVLDAAADAIRDSAADAAEDAADAARDVGADAEDVGVADAMDAAPDVAPDAAPPRREIRAECVRDGTLWTAEVEEATDPWTDVRRAVGCGVEGTAPVALAGLECQDLPVWFSTTTLRTLCGSGDPMDRGYRFRDVRFFVE